MEIKQKEKYFIIVIITLLVVLGCVFDPFRRDVLIIALCFSLCAGSFDFASGFGGLRSLGPIIPFGIGAYLHGYFIREGFPFLLSLPAVFFLTASLGSLCFILLVARREDNSSWIVFGLIASLALEQLTRLSYTNLGGSNGLIIPRYFGGDFLGAGESLIFYGFILTIVLLAFAFIGYVVFSAKGAMLLTLRYAPERLKSIGYHPHLLRVKVIFWQWALSSVAGAIYASTVGTVDPSIFGLNNNLTILIAAVAFGEKTILRPALTAFVIIMFQNMVGSIFAGTQTLLLGLAFISTLYLYNGSTLRVKVPRISLGTFGVRF